MPNKCIKITLEFTRSPTIVLQGQGATKLYDFLKDNYKDDPKVEVVESEEDSDIKRFIERYQRAYNGL